MTDLNEKDIIELINDCLAEYDGATDRIGKLVRVATERLEFELAKKGIMSRVTGRVKSRESVQGKLRKWLAHPEKFSHKIEALRAKRGLFIAMGDLAALRVMTYIENDRHKVVDLARDCFSHHPKDKNFGLEVKEDDPRIKNNENNFYRASHLQVRLRENDLVGNNANLKHDNCELQVTSMLAHVWNEIEHDIGYKSNNGQVSADEKSALASLGMLTKTGDNVIANLILANKSRIDEFRDRQNRFSNAEALTAFLDKHFGQFRVGTSAIDNGKNSHSFLDALRTLDFDHPNELVRQISPRQVIEAHQITRRMLELQRARNASKNIVELCTCDTYLTALFCSYSDEIIDTPKNKGVRFIALAKVYSDVCANT